MASAVHIPESVVIDVNPLLDMAKEGAVTIERGGESYQLIRQPLGRTAAEILADPTIKWSDATLVEDWSKDLQEIIALRKTDPYRDPWAE
jgi:hypothetical protein